MSKQLAISSAFSIFMMAAYALLGQDAAHEPPRLPAASSPVEVSASALPKLGTLLPLAR